jgi:hypothetical protein
MDDGLGSVDRQLESSSIFNRMLQIDAGRAIAVPWHRSEAAKSAPAAQLPLALARPASR